MTIKGNILLLSLSFILFNLFVSAQNQKLADSLIAIYESGNYEGDGLDVLKEICRYENNPDSVLYYSNLIIEKASRDSLFDYLQNGFLKKGNALQSKGDYHLSQDAYYESMKFAQHLNDPTIIAGVNLSLANTFSMSGNSKYAEMYFKKGIEQIRLTTDSNLLANALVNAGDEFYNSGKYELALNYFKESREIFRKLENPIGTAYSLGNAGLVYAEQGKDKLAMQNINQAITIFEKSKTYYPISVYLTIMADIYSKQDKKEEAIKYAERRLNLARQYHIQNQISNANLKLAVLLEKALDSAAAYNYYKNHIVHRDSLNNIESVEKMADLRTTFEMSQRNLLNQQKRTQRIILSAAAIALILLGMLAFGLLRRYNFIRRTSLIIEKEKNRSDHLLRNILPAETAKELKEHGSVEAKRFDSVTVLFTDFKGFTRHAEHLSPEELVKCVDFYFSNFDKIISKFGLEKIKTVGDSYMCAGGLPFPTKDHATKMILGAMDIMDFVEKSKYNNPKNETRFEVRIGISSGPVVAGVVGSKKFAYDIWGDTVNIASRMETYSAIGKINISEDTHKLIKDKFTCSYRGEMEVKNKGKLKMYFIEGLIDEDIKSNINVKEKSDFMEPKKLIDISAS